MTQPFNILTPSSAPWVGWMVLLWLIVMGLTILLQPAMMRTCLASLWSKIERQGFSSEMSLLGQLSVVVLYIGVLALCLSVLCFPSQGQHFPLDIYGSTLLVVASGIMAKTILSLGAVWLFRIDMKGNVFLQEMINAMMVMAVGLFIITVLAVYWQPARALKIAAMGVLGVGVLSMNIKMLISFVQDLLSVVLIAIYTLTIEILPLAGILYFSWNIQNVQ